MSSTSARLVEPGSVHERTAATARSRMVVDIAAISLLAVGSALLFAYLLARYPYDGLYGQDSYAYYYQSKALLQDITSTPPQAWQLFTSDGLYHWPIGYHLQLMLGLLFTNSPTGGRVLTILMTIGTSIILYLVVGEALKDFSPRARTVTGLVAGAGLPLTATYTRIGLSLMADVPSLFWGLLGVYCLLRAWPAQPGASAGRYTVIWATAAGFALGFAVLTRYGAVLLLPPLALYLLVRWREQHRTAPESRFNYLALVLAAAAFLIALLPQFAYILSHQSSASVGYSSWVAGWTPADLFSTTVTSADGTSTYAQPMLVFYLLQPFYDSDAGFLSALFVPALLLGVGTLVYRRQRLLLGCLLLWWGLSAAFFAGTPYQAQRFVLVYLPAILIVLGVGISSAVDLAVYALRGDTRHRRLLALGAAALVLVCGLGGIYEQQSSVKSWMAIHAAFKADEQKIVTLTRQAAGSYRQDAPPRVVAFGATAAIYHYTQWPLLEMYNSDEMQIESFFSTPGTHLLVLPVDSMSTQWAGTPLAASWQWLQQSYLLTSQGTAGQYTIYKVDARP